MLINMGDCRVYSWDDVCGNHTQIETRSAKVRINVTQDFRFPHFNALSIKYTSNMAAWFYAQCSDSVIDGCSMMRM